MLTKIKLLWKMYNPFDLNECFTVLKENIGGVQKSIQSVERKLDREIKTLEEELKVHRALLFSIGESIPDMMWLKDTEGKYVYANKAIRTKLLFDNNPIGKDDMELSKAAKCKFGEANHTFGEVCGNSDVVVSESLKPQRFLEHGLIEGKMVYLEVFKAPVFVDNEFIGVCGTGRDLTEYIEATASGDIEKVLAKYKFEV